MIVGLCDTQIGDNPPIVTKKFTKTKTKKSVKKSADFFFLEKSAGFLVGGEIVWWDTSLRDKYKQYGYDISDTMCLSVCRQIGYHSYDWVYELSVQKSDYIVS